MKKNTQKNINTFMIQKDGYAFAFPKEFFVLISTLQIFAKRNLQPRDFVILAWFTPSPNPATI